MKIAFWALACIFSTTVFSQNKITGTVADPNGDPLAFVTILPDDDPARGVLSGIEGQFSIVSSQPLRSLVFRCVGFETLRLEADFFKKNGDKPLKITLLPAEFGIPEVTIRPGENPADHIIRLAVAHRDANNPEKRRGFVCTTYNKIAFDMPLDSARFRQFMAGRDTTKKQNRNLNRDFAADRQRSENYHLLLMESVVERAFSPPDRTQERVLLNRVSGFENSGLVALANYVQPFSFYGDFLPVLDKNFVNPISPGSTKIYFFNLEDTLYDGADTVWVISFQPKKGKTFEALRGVLHIHTDGWAVQNVRAEPAFSGSNLWLKIEQQYRRTSTRHWFPEQLNFEMGFEKYPLAYAGLQAFGRTYITVAQTDTTLSLRRFDPENPLVIEPGAEQRADSSWADWRRLAPLTDKDQRSYQRLDSLGQRKKLDRWMHVLDVLATGLAPLRNDPPPLALDLAHILKLNEFENLRLGLGFSTAEARPLRRPRRVEGGLRAGYGFGDEAWKFGGYGLWRIARGTQTQLRVEARRDLLEPGALHELSENAVFDRSFYAQKMDLADELRLSLSSRVGKRFSVKIFSNRQKLQPRYAYRFGDDFFSGKQAFQIFETGLALRFAAKETRVNLLADETGKTQPIPVLEVAFSKGWDGAAGGEFGYARWVGVMYQRVFVRRLGRLSWRLEGGWVGGAAPVSKLFTLNQGGSGDGLTLLALANTFQSLADTLWLSDRFANLFLSQEIGPVFYRKNWSSPRLTLLQNASWGELHSAEKHHGLGFLTADKPLLESGLRLDDLLRINYLNAAYVGVGAAVFYRWGAFAEADWRRNLTPRLALRFSF